MDSTEHHKPGRQTNITSQFAIAARAFLAR